MPSNKTTYCVERAKAMFAYYKLEMPTPFPADKRAFRGAAWKQIKARQARGEVDADMVKWVWLSKRTCHDRLLLTYDNMNACVPVESVVCIANKNMEANFNEADNDNNDDTVNDNATLSSPPKRGLDEIKRQCLKARYRVNERTMPDQFFYVELDETQPNGYNTSASGLLHNWLVIDKNTNTIRTMEQKGETFQDFKTCYCESAFSVMHDHNGVRWFRVPGHPGPPGHPSTNDMLAISHPDLFDCVAYFEPTFNCGKNMRVHPPNLYRKTLQAVKKTLWAEVHFNNDFRSAKEYLAEMDEPRPADTYSVFEPIVICGRTVYEALATVADTYDVTDFYTRTKPQLPRVFGQKVPTAPWTTDLRRAIFHEDDKSIPYKLTDKQRARFAKEWEAHPDHPLNYARNLPENVRAERREVLERYIAFYEWFAPGEYTREFMERAFVWLKYTTNSKAQLLSGLQRKKDCILYYGLLTYCMRDRPEKNMERSKVEREYHSMIQNMDDEERDRTWEEVLATGYRDPRKAHKPYVCKQSEEREKGEDNWLAVSAK